MEEFQHDLLHLIADMIRILQEYEKKICDLVDREYKKEDKVSDVPSNLDNKAKKD